METKNGTSYEPIFLTAHTPYDHSVILRPLFRPKFIVPTPRAHTHLLLRSAPPNLEHMMHDALKDCANVVSPTKYSTTDILN